MINKCEYLNGKKNGKEIGYYKDGEIYYECEYLNGEKTGKDITHYFDGTRASELEHLNGEEYQKGKLFEGEFSYNKKEGRGKEYY